MTKIQKRNILICLLTKSTTKARFSKNSFFNETKSWMNLVETHFCKDKEIILIYNKYQKLWITGIHIFYELNTCILLWMFVLHTGHCPTLGAHVRQQHMCPQGRNTTPTSASRQILHVLCSRNNRFSSASSVNRK